MLRIAIDSIINYSTSSFFVDALLTLLSISFPRHDIRDIILYNDISSSFSDYNRGIIVAVFYLARIYPLNKSRILLRMFSTKADQCWRTMLDHFIVFIVHIGTTVFRAKMVFISSSIEKTLMSRSFSNFGLALSSHESEDS